jgi:hypothetical protein
VLYEDGIRVVVERWRTYKETPKGYWATYEHGVSDYPIATLRKHGMIRWVSKTSGKRYCYPELEAAFESYKYRKTSQQHKLKLQLEQVELIIANFDKIAAEPPATFESRFAGLGLGHTSTSRELRWD